MTENKKIKRKVWRLVKKEEKVWKKRDCKEMRINQRRKREGRSKTKRQITIAAKNKTWLSWYRRTREKLERKGEQTKPGKGNEEEVKYGKKRKKIWNRDRSKIG